MPVRADQEYSNSFPSSWMSIAPSIPQILLQQQEKEVHEEEAPAVAQENVQSGGEASLAEAGVLQQTLRVISKDFGYQKSEQPTPASEKVPERTATPPPRENHVKVRKVREQPAKAPKPDKSLSGYPEYSTYYPPSWTISSNVAASPKVAVKNSLSPAPASTASPATKTDNRGYSARTTSNGSVGEAFPISPVRRGRMQKEFWSLQIPRSSAEAQPMKLRSATATLNELQRLRALHSPIPARPVQNLEHYEQTVPLPSTTGTVTTERIPARPSHYSTLEPGPTYHDSRASQRDQPARVRRISTTYSDLAADV